MYTASAAYVAGGKIACVWLAHRASVMVLRPGSCYCDYVNIGMQLIIIPYALACDYWSTSTETRAGECAVAWFLALQVVDICNDPPLYAVGTLLGLHHVVTIVSSAIALGVFHEDALTGFAAGCASLEVGSGFYNILMVCNGRRWSVLAYRATMSLSNCVAACVSAGTLSLLRDRGRATLLHWCFFVLTVCICIARQRAITMAIDDAQR